MLASRFVRCLLLNSLREFKHFKTCNCISSIHFNANDALESHQNIDAYFKRLDNIFLEHSRLREMQEILDLPTTDKYFKIHFWSKFLSSAISNNKDKLLNSLIFYVLERPAIHSNLTLIYILKALASQGRFEEFGTLYTLTKSRLSPTDSIVYSADISGALCLSPFYKDAIHYLKLSIDHNLSTLSYAHILTAAAKFGPLNDAISLINELRPFGLKPQPDFYSVFVKRLNEQDGNRLMNSLLETVRNYNYSLTNTSALLIKEWFESIGWKGTMGVTPAGLSCLSCLQYLDKLHFDSDDCSKLAELFYSNVLLGKNSDELYLTTTPKELKSFLQFLEVNKSRRFECVIDLPNYLYSVAHRNLSRMPIEEQVGILVDLISGLHRTYHFKHICLVGKERAIVKKKQFWEAIKDVGNKNGINVQTFLVDHKSNDDVFMIYLALWSGPNCKLLSIDEFRQHRFTIGSEGSDLLAKWQAARQISVRSTHPLHFNDPLVCNPVIQGNMKEGWHIPYDSGEARLSYLPPMSWLCLRPPSR